MHTEIRFLIPVYRGASALRRPSILHALITSVLILATTLAWAQPEVEESEISTPAPPGPYEQVRISTEQMMLALEASSSETPEDVEDFYQVVDSIISPVVNYESIYKGVMGRKYYTQATADQRKRFKAKFRTSLIQTYAKGLLGVKDSSFEIEPPEGEIQPGRSVLVRQKLFSSNGKVEVAYRMGKSDDEVWRIKNVIIEGINLGKTFRNQFARSAREHENDIDKVIEEWTGE